MLLHRLLLLLFILCFLVLALGCREAGFVDGPGVVDSPQSVRLVPFSRPVEDASSGGEAVSALPDFSEVVTEIFSEVEKRVVKKGKKVPVIRIGRSDFRTDGRLDVAWIVKNLRIELNSRANGRYLFVDELTDQHAERWNASVYALSGYWSAIPDGFLLDISLKERVDGRVVWSEDIEFQ